MLPLFTVVAWRRARPSMPPSIVQRRRIALFTVVALLLPRKDWQVGGRFGGVASSIPCGAPNPRWVFRNPLRSSGSGCVPGARGGVLPPTSARPCFAIPNGPFLSFARQRRRGGSGLGRDLRKHAVGARLRSWSAIKPLGSKMKYGPATKDRARFFLVCPVMARHKITAWSCSRAT